MKNKLLLGIIFLFLIGFFLPQPHILPVDAICAPCSPNTDRICPKCPRKGEIIWQPSIFQRFTASNRSQVGVTPVTPAQPEMITVTGVTDCLPHRDTTGGETTECAIGLKSGEDYYAVTGWNISNVGETQTVTGRLNTSQSDLDSKYYIVGTIEVDSSGGVVTPASGLITVEGNIVCLPHRDKTGPQSKECAFGIEDGKSGKYYSFTGIDVANYQNTWGNHLRVTGSLDTSIAKDSVYDIVGMIHVTEGPGVGGVLPEDPNTVGLAQVPDLPVEEMQDGPLSVRFVVEHRSGLNGKRVRVFGEVTRAVLGEDACPNSGDSKAMGMCGQPYITLGDPENLVANNMYFLRVMVGDGAQYSTYPLGQRVEISGTVTGERMGVTLESQ